MNKQVKRVSDCPAERLAQCRGEGSPSGVKLYHVCETGLAEGVALGRITVVLGADFDRVRAERDRLLKQVARKTDVYQVKRAELTEERAKNAALQSELTKAREYIKELVAMLIKVRDSEVHEGRLLHESITKIATRNVDESCGQDAKCLTCNGTKLVSDGELTCSSGGIPYENGPIECVKDCPDCGQDAEAAEVCQFPQSCTTMCGCKPEPSADYIHTPGSGNKAQRRIAALSVDADIDPFTVCLECFGTGTICTGIMEASSTICNACDGVGREPDAKGDL